MTNDPSPVVFAGPPDAAEAIVAVPPTARGRVSVACDDAELSYRLLSAPVGTGTTLLRLVLSPTTPPGRYPARIVTEGGDLAAVIAVAERQELSVQPATLQFDLPAGGTGRVDITFHNTGNTPYVPRRAYGVGLLQNGALEAAIGDMLRMPEIRMRETGRSRLEEAGDTLADRYGGTARLVITGLDGPVEPGAYGTATAELQLDRRAQSTRGYHGLWELEGARIPVSVTIGGERERRRGGRADHPTAEQDDTAAEQHDPAAEGPP
ncbi:hypothetical protein [Streptomyces graminilatus]|uniref:hypothetical protein n=1 Tax=Streptomyces graminilatus TaxID=1464070 RepID=UPI0006E18E7E|nr:hypothetical protein [Streptomyces graminilatus]